MTSSGEMKPEKNFPFTRAEITALVHATEDEDKVRKALYEIVPIDSPIARSLTRGHHGGGIVILQVDLGKSQIMRWWESLVEKMGPHGLQILKTSIWSRVDDNCVLYLRFDKQEAYRGKAVLCEHGDSIHGKVKISAYPAKQKNAVERVLGFLEDG